ncbi:KamA family radical SAM protein [Nocardia sp. CDC160]|uniref:KamA family radical SAM protein n=1 Tax=Nocardia sp. CDC160 TaxID=3112166 RepID=UPI002DB92DEC|nr:lysine 2,3-aminomutase [Nocardia sp. CDC160]MEC3914775.1 lysine 2,3-aminomutase [Nocardia sp. CDC160]
MSLGTTEYGFRAIGARELPAIAARAGLDAAAALELAAVAAVLPFRTNRYVLDELIDWTRAPEDPIFRLTMPHPGMLTDDDRAEVVSLLVGRASAAEIRHTATRIRKAMNPHPEEQRTLNRPEAEGESFEGLQHKYRSTVLYFPSNGQTCHAYCAYCFRWAQFVGDPELHMAAPGPETLLRYLKRHPEVSDVLVTGGDPMIMSARVLARHLEPLLAPEFEQLSSIRLGTKALAFWPHRFVTDPDADELLALLSRITASGRHLALMAHVSHTRELETDIVRTAIARLQGTGATIRCQSPLVRTVNDSARDWIALWQSEVRLGMIPYYMFVERDTGPRDHFAVPLAASAALFTEAYRSVPGLARTVRGPVMSATPGKIVIDGVTTIADRRVFALRFLQARNESLVGTPFFANYSETARWLDDLTPAFAPRFPHESSGMPFL